MSGQAYRGPYAVLNTYEIDAVLHLLKTGPVTNVHSNLREKLQATKTETSKKNRTPHS